MADPKIDFRALVSKAFATICRDYGFVMIEEGRFILRLDAPAVFLTVGYNYFRSQELGADIGLQAGITHPVERPFELSEFLRVVGLYELPEAQLDETVASPQEVPSALDRLANLYVTHGAAALRGDHKFFARLDAQRDLDCYRYANAPRLDLASRAAHVAWVKREYRSVVSLLTPFAAKLTPSENRILEASKKKAIRGRS